MFTLIIILHTSIIMSEGPMTADVCETMRAVATQVWRELPPNHPDWTNAQALKAECRSNLVS